MPSPLLVDMHRSIGNRSVSQSADNAPISFDQSTQNRSNQADQMMFQYRDIDCMQGGNLPHTLALMQREKKKLILWPQWPLCPWPSQRSGLALNYSHLSAQ